MVHRHQQVRLRGELEAGHARDVALQRHDARVRGSVAQQAGEGEGGQQRRPRALCPAGEDSLDEQRRGGGAARRESPAASGAVASVVENLGAEKGLYLVHAGRQIS